MSSTVPHSRHTFNFLFSIIWSVFQNGSESHLHNERGHCHLASVCVLGLISNGIRVMLSHSCSQRLPASQSKEEKGCLFILGLCVWWESMCRIHSVITSARSSLISNVLAVSCFIGNGLKEKAEYYTDKYSTCNWTQEQPCQCSLVSCLSGVRISGYICLRALGHPLPPL